MNVWYQLYLGDTPEGQPGRVPLNDDAIVFDLKEAVKEEWLELKDTTAARLRVFAASADPNKDEPLRGDATVPDNTTYDKPLIVVAPAPVALLQDGEFSEAYPCLRLLC
jgi:hypothetical protein